MYCRILLALPLLYSVFATAAGAEYPDHPIRMIVPQAAGSSTDTLTRFLASALSDELHQQVVVDDRPGGALTLGLDLTAKSAPDGYTLCMGPIGAFVSPTTPFHSVAELVNYAKQNPGKLLNASSSNGSPARPCRRRAVQIHDRHRDRPRAVQKAARRRSMI